MVYPETINLYTKISKQAVEDLLAHANQLGANKKYKESTKVFQDPSIFYRIAVKVHTVIELEDIEVYQLNERCKLIKRWIKAHPSGTSPLPRNIEGLTPWFIFCTVDFDIQIERNTGGESWPLIPLIESALFSTSCLDDNHNYHYAGATVPSAIVHIMEDYFGLSPNIPATFDPPEARRERYEWAAADLEKLKGIPLEVRMWVDLLADEIEKRYHASNANNETLI